MGEDITPFDDDIAAGYVTRGGNVPCNGDIVGGDHRSCNGNVYGGEVILWKTLEGETLPGETLHHAMATLHRETSIGGEVDGKRFHGVRGQRMRHHGRRQNMEHW